MSNEIHEDSENEADRTDKRPWHPIGALEPAGETDAEKIESDRLEEPAAVAGLVNPDSGLATDADKFEADGLDQPSHVAGLTNLDDGRATDAQKIDADGLE